MPNPLHLRCALAVLLLLSLTSGCKTAPEPPAAAPVPAATVPVPIPAQPEPSAPVSREDALACEALVDLRALMARQREYFGEKDTFAADASSLLLALPGCADGTRAEAPDASWLSGCHFRYRVSATSPLPEATYTVQAVGSGAAAGREYTLREGGRDADRSWPSALTPDVCGARLAPSVCEAALNLRGLFTAERAYFAEKDRYSDDLLTVGFVPESCLDGTRADGQPAPGAGCHFHYAVEVQGTAPEQTFLAKARGTGPMEGVTLQYSSSSVWTPAGVDVRPCFDTGQPLACEAAMNLRYLFTAQKAHFQEYDRYSEDLARVGFLPEGCIDGSHAVGGEAPEVAGCHYVYRVEVQGNAPEQTFTGIARGVGEAAGTELRIDSAGLFAPAEPACGR